MPTTSKTPFVFSNTYLFFLSQKEISPRYFACFFNIYVEIFSMYSITSDFYLNIFWDPHDCANSLFSHFDFCTLLLYINITLILFNNANETYCFFSLNDIYSWAERNSLIWCSMMYYIFIYSWWHLSHLNHLSYPRIMKFLS